MSYKVSPDVKHENKVTNLEIIKTNSPIWYEYAFKVWC